MQDRLTAIEARLASIEQRLDALEGVARRPADQEDLPAVEGLSGESLAAVASAHIGRVLLIFGGAYLLRAMTDFDFVPTGIGLAMGAAYALFWLYLAWLRAADTARRSTAAFYGATSVVLILPLLVEAATKFGLLTGAHALTAVAVYFGLALGVGVQRNLRSVAWFATLGTGAAAFALLITTQAALAAAALLLFVGLASLWTVYLCRWSALQWFGALAAGLAAVALITLSQSPRWSLDTASAAVFATLLLLAYLASFAARSNLQRRDLGTFEALFAPAAVALAFWAVGVSAFGASLIGSLAVVLGVATYALALDARNRSDHRRNFYLYSALGLLFFVAGTLYLLPASVAAAVWAVTAIVLAWFSGRRGWVSLSLQSTVLLVAAGAGSGLLATGLEAFVSAAGPGWPALSPWLVGVALAAVVCLFLPVAQRSERWGALAGLPQLIVLGLSVWEVGGLMVVASGPILAGAGTEAVELSVLAALRTVVLSAAAVTLALSSRHPRWPEARWLVYPVLILVALKLFTEDFPVGQAATLFVALAFVGGALLAVARLLARPEARSGAEPAARDDASGRADDPTTPGIDARSLP